MRCAACKRQIRDRETQCESSLYGSRHILCEPCGQSEETQIDTAGTNNLPELLSTYGHPNDESRT